MQAPGFRPQAPGRTHWPAACSLQPAAFSLVELVISLAILSIGLVGAMRVFPVGLRASQRAEMSSRAALAAQRALESLKLQSWEALEAGEAVAEEAPFTIITRISQPASAHLADPARLKALEITVEWDQDGRSRALTFLTYVRRETS